jgi:ParB family transcriptional regulator, chromosome partitioning protein
MNVTDFVCPAKHAWAQLDEIEIQQRARPYNATEVVALKASIQAIGLQTPLTVVERDGRHVLVAGRHRLEALRLLKAERVPVRIVAFDDTEARLWTISENLHRNELTVTQRAEQIAEWIRLTEALEQSAQFGPAVLSDGRKAGPQHRASGINAASRELGITRQEGHRAVKIDAIVPAAKDAMRVARLDNNQSVALKVASYADADQVEAVAEIVAEREQRPKQPDLAMPPNPPAKDTARPLRDLTNLSAGELARWIKITTPNDRPHVITMLRRTADILEMEIVMAPQ